MDELLSRQDKSRGYCVADIGNVLYLHPAETALAQAMQIKLSFGRISALRALLYLHPAETALAQAMQVKPSPGRISAFRPGGVSLTANFPKKLFSEAADSPAIRRVSKRARSNEAPEKTKIAARRAGGK